MLGKGLESLIPPSESEEEKLLPQESASLELPADDSQPVPAATPVSAAQPSAALPTVSPSAPRATPSVPVRKRIPERGHVPHQAAEPAFAEASAGKQSVFQIEVEKIAPNPHQPRREFNEESLKGLAQSIREFGILQPLVVTKVEHETPT